MAEFDKLSEYVDKSALEKETDFILAQFKRVEDGAEQMARKIQEATRLNTSGSGGGNTASSSPAPSSGGGSTSGNGTAGSAKASAVAMKELELTTTNYKKILEALGGEVDKLTKKQRDQLKTIQDNLNVQEKANRESEKTRKTTTDETAANREKEAGLRALAEQLARNKKAAADEAYQIKLSAAVEESGRNTKARAVALIRQYTNESNKLNLATERGRFLNEVYKKAIAGANEFLLKNADIETKRVKNIGNYNAASEIVVKALEKERLKLDELIAARAKYNAAGAAKPVAGFSRGNNPDDASARANTGGTGFAEIGKDAEFAQKEIEELDAKIAQSRTVIEGFNRVSKDLPIVKAAESADKEVKRLNASLLLLEKNGLGSSDAANLLRIRINELEGSLVRATAAGQALDLINVEIAELAKTMNTLDKGSTEFGVMTKEMALLKEVATQLNRTFPTTARELRALEDAGKKIGTQYGTASRQFREFAKVVGERKDQIKDAQNAISFQASDTKYIDATIQGIQAITGAYGAYQSIVALTGVENEELARSMQKLQAVTALVVSIQSIANAVQTDSALVQAALAVKASYLAIVEKLVTKTLNENTVAAGANAIATAANTAVRQTSIATLFEQQAAITGTTGAQLLATGAMRAQAAAQVQSAIAMKGQITSATVLAPALRGVAVAQTAVTTTARAMRAALISSGIGILIAAIGFAVYKLIDALDSWNESSKRVREADKALAETLSSLTDALVKYEEIRRVSAANELAALDRMIERRKAAGITSGQALALDKERNKVVLENALAEQKANNVTAQSVEDKRLAYEDAAASVRASTDNRNELEKEFRNVDEYAVKKYGRINDFAKKYKQQVIDDYADRKVIQDKEIEDATARLGTFEKLYTRERDLFNGVTEAQQAVNLATIAENKLAADERRKFIQESAKIEADLQISRNEAVLNNDRSTLEQRTAALRSNLEARRRIIAADNAAIQSDPTISGSEKALADKKAAADAQKAEQENLIAIRKIREDFRLRDLQAEQAMATLILNTIVDTNEKILENEALTEAERLDALRNSIAARTALLDKEFETKLSAAGIADADIERIKETGFFEIANKKITNAELLTLVTEYNQGQVNITKDAQVKLVAITKDYYEQEKDIREKALRDVETRNLFNIQAQEEEYTKSLEKLNTQLKNKEITIEGYNKRREKLDRDHQRKLLVQEIDRTQEALDNMVNSKQIEKDLIAERDRIRNAGGPLSDAERQANADRLAVIDEELLAIGEAIDAETGMRIDLSRLRQRLQDSDTENFMTNNEKVVQELQRIQAVAQVVTDAISGVLDGINQRRQAETTAELELIEKRREKELATNEAIAQSEADRNAKALLINARAEAQKEASVQRQKQRDRDRAVADKNIAIFQIVLATAVAVASAKGIFDKILAAVSGAAQLAIAIATPIPKFKRGLFKDYTGPAWVGDGGKKEAIIRKTGEVEITDDKPELTYINEGDRIEPDAGVFLQKMQGSAMREVARKTQHSEGLSEAQYGRMMIDELKRTGRQIVGAIQGKEHLNMNVTERGIVAFWGHGRTITHYIDEQTNWS